MTEQEILQDALIATKYLQAMYNQFELEGSNTTLRSLLIEHFTEVSNHNFIIFQIMEKEGFYPVTQAQAKEVNQAIKMHTEMQTALDKKLQQD